MAVSAFVGDDTRLRIVASYEDGRVALFELSREVTDWSEGFAGENEGWVKVFEEKQHREPSEWTGAVFGMLLVSGQLIHVGHNASPSAMSLALEAGLRHAWSVGADHMVVRYRLGTEVSSVRQCTGFVQKLTLPLYADLRRPSMSGAERTKQPTPAAPVLRYVTMAAYSQLQAGMASGLLLTPARSSATVGSRLVAQRPDPLRQDLQAACRARVP